MCRHQKASVLRVATAIFLGTVSIVGAACAQAAAPDETACIVDPGVVANMSAIDTSIAACSAVLAQRPNDERALSTRGILHYYKGQDDQAIADLTRAIAIEPKNSASWFNRGRSHEAKGHYDLAVQDYTHALTIGPQHQVGLVRVYRARAFQKAGKLDDAIADYNAVIEQSPHEADVYNSRARLYLQKAVADYERALKIRPKALPGERMSTANTSN